MTENGAGKKPMATVRTRVAEIIGRVAVAGSTLWQGLGFGSIDQTTPDYIFWDKFRRGKSVGFELVGVLAKPICQIVAGWVLGSGIDAKLTTPEGAEKDTDPVHYTNTLLERFLARIHGLLNTLVEDLYGLGNQYVIVNNDSSLSVPTPNMVDMEQDPLDYRTIIKCTITTKLDKATIKDVYTADTRVISIKITDKALEERFQGGGWVAIGSGEYQQEFVNLLGKIPVVHFANDRSGNETNGRPIYEGLLHLFRRYSVLLAKMIDGAEIMGNPLPVFEGLDNVEETVEAVTEPIDQTFTNPDGTQGSRRRINWDSLPALFIGKGGSFKFAAPPGGFTDDIKNVLKLLFTLILEFTRIPEGMWGTELSSARATFTEQMKTFYAYIESRRVALAGMGADDVLGDEARGGLLELLDLWLRARALIDTRVVIAPVTLDFQALSDEDAALLQQSVKDAFTNGVITKVTYAKQLPFVVDAEAEVEAANKEIAERNPAAQADQQFNASVDALLNDGAAAA